MPPEGHAALGAQEKGSKEEGSLEGPSVESASEAQREKGEGSGHRQAGRAEADHLEFRWHGSGRVVWLYDRGDQSFSNWI